MIVAVAKKGILRATPWLVLAAAGVANTATLWQLTGWAGMVGIKTVKIKRLKCVNYSGANTYLYIGTGLLALGFVQAMPRLRLMNGFNDDFVEGDLPEVEFSANITCYVDNATCEIQAQVEEIG